MVSSELTVFDSKTRFLSKIEIVGEINHRPGLIPVDIDIDQQRLIWLDMGRYHIYEGRFRNAVNTFTSLNNLLSSTKDPCYFTSDVDVLQTGQVLVDSVYPSGLIFNMSRCGSTLLTKALAHTRTNLVFGEAAPHSKIWQYLGGDCPWAIENSEQNLTIYRNLILTMGRRRLPEYNAHFIKFTSFNILFIRMIMTAFPDVPAIFLYRDPASVMTSLSRRGAAWHLAKDSAWGEFISGSDRAAGLKRLSYYSDALGNFMSAALQGATQGLHYLNYDYLSADKLARILAIFGIDYTNEQITAMQHQFSHYSKSEYYTVPFSSDTARKKQSVTPEIKALIGRQLDSLYFQLLESPRNIV